MGTWVRIATGVGIWLFAALGGLVLILLSRAITGTVQYVRGSGRVLPMIIHTGPSENGAPAAEGAQTGRRLAAHLAAHMADTSSEPVLAPGTAAPVPAAPSPQASPTPHGWIDAMLRIAVARPRAFHIHLMEMPDTDDDRPRVAVRIVRAPQGYIVAADVITKAAEEELVEALACFCTVRVRGHPDMQRRIPRWERWHSDVRGYTYYRQGIARQERAQRQEQSGRKLPVVVSWNVRRRYDPAMKAFAGAAEFSPANLTLRLRQAAVHELVGSYRHKEYAKAIEIYQRCTELWPEHIETAYRTAIAYSRASTPSRRGSPRLPDAEFRRMHAIAEQHFDDLARRLRFATLLRQWARTVVPGGRFNSGERRYWSSWLTPLPLPARRSRRRTFKGALITARAAHTLGGALRTAHDDPRGEDVREEIVLAFTDVANQVMVRSRGSGHQRLLFPQRSHAAFRSHAPGWHESHLANRPTSRFWGPLRRPGAGWLAHYNAACFLALAIRLDPAFRPGDYTQDAHWREDCARSALNQLDNSLRTPDTELTTGWILHDPDLAVLWKTELGARWAQFMGVSLANRHYPVRAGAG